MCHFNTMTKRPAPLNAYCPEDWKTLVLDASGLELQAFAAHMAIEHSYDFITKRLGELEQQRNELAPRAQEGITGAIRELRAIVSEQIDTMAALTTRRSVLVVASCTRYGASQLCFSTLYDAAIEASNICHIINTKLPDSFGDILEAANNSLDSLLGDLALT